MALTVLVTMHGLTGDSRYADRAVELATRLSGLAEHAPRFAGQTLTALEAMADGPRQVAVVGDLADPATHAMVRAAHALAHPGSGDRGRATAATATVPLLEARVARRGTSDGVRLSRLRLRPARDGSRPALPVTAP